MKLFIITLVCIIALAGYSQTRTKYKIEVQDKNANPTTLTNCQHYYYNDKDYIAYKVIGSGPKNLIFLHGFGASTISWYDLIPYFNPQEYTLYLVDLKGFGQSSEVKKGDFSIEANAKIIEKFIQSKKLSNYWLLGHSYGGGIILYYNYCAKDKENFKGMVLIDNACYPYKLPYFISLFRWPILGELVFNLSTKRYKAKNMLKTCFFDHSKFNEETIKNYCTFFKKDKFSAIKQTAKQIFTSVNDGMLNSYTNISLPTLIIWGKQDKILSYTLAERLNKDIPNSELKIIDKCGHSPHEEYPELTADYILDVVGK